MKPVCFESPDQKPRMGEVDEKHFRTFAAELYQRFRRLPPGRHFEFVGSREKAGNQRIDGYFVERSYPLQDDSVTGLDSRVTLSIEVDNA